MFGLSVSLVVLDWKSIDGTFYIEYNWSFKITFLTEKFIFATLLFFQIAFRQFILFLKIFYHNNHR